MKIFTREQPPGYESLKLFDLIYATGGSPGSSFETAMGYLVENMKHAAEKQCKSAQAIYNFKWSYSVDSLCLLVGTGDLYYVR